MVTLKFKDELGGKSIKEFIGLKPKLYSILCDEKQKMLAKAVTKFAQNKQTHDLYKQVFTTGQSFRTVNRNRFEKSSVAHYPL